MSAILYGGIKPFVDESAQTPGGKKLLAIREQQQVRNLPQLGAREALAYHRFPRDPVRKTLSGFPRPCLVWDRAGQGAPGQASLSSRPGKEPTRIAPLERRDTEGENDPPADA